MCQDPPDGDSYALAIGATDGVTSLVFMTMDFVYQGEGTVAFGSLDPEVLLHSG
jgi:hypothetical protein